MLKLSHFPLELLRIVPGQRVTIDKQTPQHVDLMIRQCQTLPHEFVALNSEARENAVIANSNPYFRAHNVRVETDLMRARADLLWPPAITYSQDGRDRD